jgi:hypothetical protein
LFQSKNERTAYRERLDAPKVGGKAQGDGKAFYYWESGKRECGFDMLIKIADLFNTSIDYLVGRTD